MIDSVDLSKACPVWPWLCDRINIRCVSALNGATTMDGLRKVWAELGLEAEGRVNPGDMPRSLWRIWDLSEIAKIHE